MNKSIKIVVVDDHPLFAQGTAQVLDRMPGIRAVGFAGDLAQARLMVAARRPDVVLCDVMLGDAPRGFELPALLDADLDERPPIIFMSQFVNDVLVQRATSVGAAGYLAKTADPETLRAAVLAVAGGSTVFPRATPTQPTNQPRLPSPREAEVLRLMADGKSNTEIAAELGIAESTVETHLDRLRTRYGLGTRTELAVFADRQGWLSPAARVLAKLNDGE